MSEVLEALIADWENAVSLCGSCLLASKGEEWMQHYAYQSK